MGLYGALQQHTLNRANAYAAEALAQPLAVAARVDKGTCICKATECCSRASLTKSTYRPPVCRTFQRRRAACPGAGGAPRRTRTSLTRTSLGRTAYHRVVHVPQVAAHAARPQMLQEYSARVRAYLEVIRP